MRAAESRQRIEAQRLHTLAWHIVAYSRARTLPGLRSILKKFEPKTKKPEKTAEQLAAEFEDMKRRMLPNGRR